MRIKKTWFQRNENKFNLFDSNEVKILKKKIVKENGFSKVRIRKLWKRMMTFNQFINIVTKQIVPLT